MKCYEGVANVDPFASNRAVEHFMIQQKYGCFDECHIAATSATNAEPLNLSPSKRGLLLHLTLRFLQALGSEIFDLLRRARTEEP